MAETDTGDIEDGVGRAARQHADPDPDLTNTRHPVILPDYCGRVAREVRLRDGSLALTWMLLPEDRRGLAQGYSALSPESRYRRFLTGMPELTESMLTRLVDEVDGVNHVALVLVVLDDDLDAHGAAVGRMIRLSDDPEAADVAVTVAEEFRGRGAASVLLRELVAKRPVGVKRIVTQIAAENAPSLAMLQRLGPTTVVADGADCFEVTVELPAPE